MSFRSDLTTLTDFIRAPEFRTTVIAAALLAAAIALGNVAGLHVTSQTEVAATIYIGAIVASLTCLGAWTGLRDCPLKNRLPISLLLILVAVAADFIGHRLDSSSPSQIAIPIAFLTIYLASWAAFGVARRFGWRLVHTDRRATTRHFSLASLLVWITVCAAILSAVSWAAGDIDVSDPLGLVATAVGLGLGTALFAIPVLIPICLYVFGGPNSRWKNILGATTLVVTGVSLSGFFMSNSTVCFAPIVATSIAFWLMQGFASIGYRFDQTKPSQPSRRIFVAGAAALLAATILVGTTLSPLRVDHQRKAQWRDKGVHAITLSGEDIVFAAFDDSTPVTQGAVDLLKNQTKLTIVESQDAVTAEQIEMLAELKSVKTLILEGANVSDEHLERLHGATHLEEIIYSRIGAKPKSIDALKQKLEPNVIVRDMWAPQPATVTVPGIVTTRDITTQ